MGNIIVDLDAHKLKLIDFGLVKFVMPRAHGVSLVGKYQNLVRSLNSLVAEHCGSDKLSMRVSNGVSVLGQR